MRLARTLMSRIAEAYIMVPTRDHDKIREWAAKHNASPAQLQRLVFDGQPAILTFLLGNAPAAEPEITLISWESFFAQFDLLGLAFAYHGDTALFDIVRIEAPTQHEIGH